MKQFFKSFGKGICYVGVFLGTQVLVTNVIVMYYSFIMGIELAQNATDINVAEIEATLMEKIMGATPLIAFISGIIAVVFACILFKVRHKNVKVEMNLQPIGWKTIPLLCVMGISLNFLISYVMIILPIPESVMESYELQSSALTEISLLVFLATVLVAPIAEEVFCRGLMLSRFQKGMPITVAIIAQAIIFGLLHGHPLWIAYTTLVGVVFGVIAYKQRSIIGTIIMHAVFNFTAFMMTVMQLEGDNIVINMVVIVISGVVTIALGIVLLKYSYTPRRIETIVEE